MYGLVRHHDLAPWRPGMPQTASSALSFPPETDLVCLEVVGQPAATVHAWFIDLPRAYQEAVLIQIVAYRALTDPLALRLAAMCDPISPESSSAHAAASGRACLPASVLRLVKA